MEHRPEGGRFRGGNPFHSNNSNERGGVGRGRWGSSGGRSRGRGYYGRGYSEDGGDDRNRRPNNYNNNNQFQGGRGRGRGNRSNNNNNNRRNLDESSTCHVIEEIGCTPSENTTVSIAIEGCCHGELDRIYDRIAKHEKDTGQKIDLLLCCGDFQSVRNISDFHSLAVPPKYRSLGTFYKYYSGVKIAPILTIFVGGNHEASQALQELYYGGWVAPNIYYLGAAGVVLYNGIRIGGISGIYKSHDYNFGRYEKPPYDPSSLRSIYHIRNIEIERLKCLASSLSSSSNILDIMISHDWPQGIEQYGNTAELLRQKPFFRKEVQENNLGSPPNRELLDTLKPRYWFAAHLHVKFKAVVNHTAAAAKLDEREKGVAGSIGTLVPSQLIGSKVKPFSSDTTTQNDGDESTTANDASTNDTSIPQQTEFMAFESSKQNSCTVGSDLTDQMTQFLSLDKCLPRREYLSILHIPVSKREDNPKLEYDPEWLAVIRKSHNLQSIERRRIDIQQHQISDMKVTPDEIQTIRSLFSESLIIPCNFRPTVPAFTTEPPSPVPHRLPPPYAMMGNPQTDELLDKLRLDHIVTIPWDNQFVMASTVTVIPGTNNNDITKDEDEINIDDDGENDEELDVDAECELNDSTKPEDLASIEIPADIDNNDTSIDAGTNKKARISVGDPSQK